jgi:predicted secreted hydrolase
MSSARAKLFRILAVCQLLAACGPAPPLAPGGDFALLARSAPGFSAARPGYALAFPRDHGAHPGFRIEWWYLTANLEDSEGRAYGVQWTLFRLATQPPGVKAAANPWHDSQVYMAHMALTWPAGHVGFQRYARGGDHAGVAQAGVRAEPFAAWLDDWSLRSSGPGWLPLMVAARQGDFAFDLALRSDRGLVLQGEAGFSAKHADGSGSYYYSHPFLQASGTLTIAGRAIAVAGDAWLDREWSSQFLQPDQSGWDWFALHLDSGEKLLLFRLRAAPDVAGSPAVQFAVLISPDGGKTPLQGSLVRFEPVGFERMAGRELPLHWRIALPEIGRRIELHALQPDQWMDVDFAYWEGTVVVTGDSAGERGRGYMELTGYPAD